MKFIHLADVHLGAAPDAGMPWSGERKRQIWATFRDVIRDAGREQADLLLIAGDLFHRPPSEEELCELDYLFSTLPRTRIVLIAGNHDYLSPESAYLTHSFGPNVACLFAGECECVRFPEIHTEVYGFSYETREITEPLYDDLQPMANEYFHILLAHGGDADHIPISREKMEDSDFDYIALGHIHKGGVLVPDKAVYPGALEPIDCADEGEHGYILGEVRGCRVTTRFVPAARCEYRTIRLACSGQDTSFSLQDRLEKMIREQGTQHIYRVVLTGQHAPGARFDRRALSGCGKVLSVTDETASELPLQELKTRYRDSLIGRYIDSFSDGPLDETQEKALEYGLEALLGARVQER